MNKITTPKCIDTRPLQFLYADDEMEAMIYENARSKCTLSIGYKDGQFALFLYDEKDINEQDPYLFRIIATGTKKHYQEVKIYVENFLYLDS